jgi:hypothetical protein
VDNTVRVDAALPRLRLGFLTHLHVGDDARPAPDQILTALERIANEVAPALGWI